MCSKHISDFSSEMLVCSVYSFSDMISSQGVHKGKIISNQFTGKNLFGHNYLRQMCKSTHVVFYEGHLLDVQGVHDYRDPCNTGIFFSIFLDL